MSEIFAIGAPPPRTPWHLWVVGVLALLWNSAGALTIMSAQAGNLPDIEPAEAAYYAAQARWFAVAVDLALVAAILAALAILLRKRWAVPMYGLSIAAIALTAAYEVSAGTAYILVDQGALAVTCLIWALSALQFLYALAMEKRGVLR